MFACSFIAPISSGSDASPENLFSLFEIHADSTGSTKPKVEPVVGLQPTVAREFKRAGFLKGEAIETPPLIRL
ncbi:MAG: hypothetical protein RLO04_10645 [Limnobacter sp.]|uniref:hypothetical protein n=1 Tax=Limnobacter sp. TaxID=2003368 RepID=UPI0032EC7E78